jgi:glycosyltransferase involved in cell wall biosynthesis
MGEEGTLRMKLSVVIPVYNERSTIEEVVRKVKAVPLEKEIIIVDDGSTDGTSEIVQRLSKDVTQVHCSRVNFGKGAAIRLGLTYVTGDAVIIQDADLELDPNEYLGLLDRLGRGDADVVYGSRFARKNRKVRLVRRLANGFLSALTRVLYGCSLTDMETAYKLFRTDVIRRVRLRSIGFEFEPEVTAKLLRLGHTIAEVPVNYNPRTVEEGKKIRWTDGVKAIQWLLKCRFCPVGDLTAPQRTGAPKAV